MSPRRDIKEFDQACRAVGLTASEQHLASEELHAEKRSSGMKEHIPYKELVAWLRQWKEDRWQQS
jgi:hypothetical protein